MLGYITIFIRISEVKSFIIIINSSVSNVQSENITITPVCINNRISVKIISTQIITICIKTIIITARQHRSNRTVNH